MDGENESANEVEEVPPPMSKKTETLIKTALEEVYRKYPAPDHARSVKKLTDHYVLAVFRHFDLHRQRKSPEEVKTLALAVVNRIDGISRYSSFQAFYNRFRKVYEKKTQESIDDFAEKENQQQSHASKHNKNAVIDLDEDNSVFRSIKVEKDKSDLEGAIVKSRLKEMESLKEKIKAKNREVDYAHAFGGSSDTLLTKNKVIASFENKKDC